MKNEHGAHQDSPNDVVFFPGLEPLLSYEAECFMAKGGKHFPAPLRRRLSLLVSAVLNPKKLLVHGETGELDRRCFAKTYGRNPEAFIELMLHLKSNLAKLRGDPIKRALRENSEITVVDDGIKITKPINRATEKELASFIETHYGVKTVPPRTAARARQRMAKADSKLPDGERLTRNAVRLFREMIAPETWTIPVPTDT